MMTMTQKKSSVEKKPFQLSNLRVRLLTAIVLLPVVIAAMYAGGIVWMLLLAVIAVIGLLEFFALAEGRESQGCALTGIPAALALMVVFYLNQPALSLLVLAICIVATFVLEWLRHPNALNRTLWQVFTTLAGVIYIGFPLAFLVAVSRFTDGFLWLVVIASCTWGTDTAAYFGGRFFGKRKLAPKLSPKKTVEGAVIGLLGGFCLALLFVLYADKLTTASLALIIIAPFVAILGDLFESAIKRFFKAKDSHVHGLNIIPGHGGVLDRVDALLMVSAFSYLFIRVTGIAA